MGDITQAQVPKIYARLAGKEYPPTYTFLERAGACDGAYMGEH